MKWTELHRETCQPSMYTTAKLENVENVDPQFQSNSTSWQRVSTKYAIADLLSNLIVAVIVIGVLVSVFLGTGWEWWSTLTVSAVGVFLIISSLLSFRRVKAIGYMLREDDLIFRRGIMFERIIAVPYGRLQLVDVTRGPLLRALGLANLKFVTAAVATGVQLPGLTLAEAELLRDKLVALAETRRSGL